MRDIGGGRVGKTQQTFEQARVLRDAVQPIGIVGRLVVGAFDRPLNLAARGFKQRFLTEDDGRFGQVIQPAAERGEGRLILSELPFELCGQTPALGAGGIVAHEIRKDLPGGVGVVSVQVRSRESAGDREAAGLEGLGRGQPFDRGGPAALGEVFQALFEFRG